MLSVKAEATADTIFKVFGMTQLRIKLSLPWFAGERLVLQRNVLKMC